MAGDKSSHIESKYQVVAYRVSGDITSVVT